MNNSIQLIKEIEKTHHGLGIPILFNNLAILAGISVMNIAEMGEGKGTIISSASPLGINQGYDLIVDTLTLTEMVSRVGYAENVNMLWRMKEWGTMTKYHRELFLTLGSKIITDHEFYHQMGEKKGVPVVIDIKNCNLTALIGITPLKFSRMISENENWASLASDRFVKFILFNSLREDTITTLPEHQIHGEYTFSEIAIDTELKLIRRLLRKQVSENRLPVFARNLLRAYSIFEGHGKCTMQDELDFYQLFWAYLEPYGNFIYSYDIEEEPHLQVGSLRLFGMTAKHEGIDLQTLLDNFGVYEKATIKRKDTQESKHLDYKRMIDRHAEVLIDRDMISITHNSPDKFYLSNRYQNYFEWYRSISK